MPPWLSRSRPVAQQPPGGLPIGAGPVLLTLARSAIAGELGEPAGTEPLPAWLDRRGASFVTLRRAGRLQGCIGSATAWRPLGADVERNARAAAFRDRRFPPLTADVLGEIAVEVSVLGPPSPLAARDEAEARALLRPGADGVVLECRGRRSVLLPQAWQSLPQPRDFLAHLVVKAGLPPDVWDDGVVLSRFTVSVFQEADDE